MCDSSSVYERAKFEDTTDKHEECDCEDNQDGESNNGDN